MERPILLPAKTRLILVLVFALFSCCVPGVFGGCVGAQISFDDNKSIASTNISTTDTLSRQEVIASYSPAKILQIEDERGPSYKQSYPYLQKSRTFNASAIVSSTIGVGGVRFIVDQGRTGETVINDTNTSDTVFRAQFNRLSYGNHSLIIYYDTQ